MQRDLLRFAQVFSQMIHVGANTLRLPNVLTVLQACIAELRINRCKSAAPGPKDDLKVVNEEYDANIITSLYLCTIISKLLQPNGAANSAAAGGTGKPQPNNGMKAERMASYKLVYELVAMRLQMPNGFTLLHLAVDRGTPVDDFHISDVCRFPCADTIRLLLLCGARVNVFDCDRNSPLHILTSMVSSSSM